MNNKRSKINERITSIEKRFSDIDSKLSRLLKEKEMPNYLGFNMKYLRSQEYIELNLKIMDRLSGFPR